MRQATAQHAGRHGCPADDAWPPGIVTPTTESPTRPRPTVAITAPAAGRTLAQGSLITVSGHRLRRRRPGRRRRGLDRRRGELPPGHRHDELVLHRRSSAATAPSAVQVARDRRLGADVSAAATRRRRPRPARARSSACPPRRRPTPATARDRDARRPSSPPTRDGFISGIRFYKSAANTGTHTGTLYAADRRRARRPGPSPTRPARGWQTLAFARGVPVTAGTTYVAAYHAPSGHYSADAVLLRPGPHAGVLTAPGATAVDQRRLRRRHRLPAAAPTSRRTTTSTPSGRRRDTIPVAGHDGHARWPERRIGRPRRTVPRRPSPSRTSTRPRS